MPLAALIFVASLVRYTAPMRPTIAHAIAWTVSLVHSRQQMERVVKNALILVQAIIHKELCARRARRERLQLRIEALVQVALRVNSAVTAASVCDVRQENNRMIFTATVIRAT